MKNKEQEIKSIKEAQRELADRLEALEKPEAGDVYLTSEGNHVLITQAGEKTGAAWFHDGFHMKGLVGGSETYLGKHNEVFVKISDVRDALSHRDEGGETFIEFLVGPSGGLGASDTAKALRKLKIITD